MIHILYHACKYDKCTRLRENNLARYLVVVFNKTIILLTLIGHEMVIANLVLRASLAIYHLIFQRALVE